MAELHQQIVQNKIEEFVHNLKVPQDQAFERLVYSLTTGGSAQTPDLDDWVDGSQDKQVDIIRIEDGQGDADVYIIQAKYVDSFKSNDLILMGNGLQWIFGANQAELATLKNLDFRDKIKELRATLSGCGYSNARIHCYFATKAPELTLSEEFQQERKRILSKFHNGTFESFTLDPLSSTELIELTKQAERKAKSVDVDLVIRYDTNNPSVIKYQSQGQKGIICTCDASQIAELVNADPHGAIFDSNIRRFLGKTKAVNVDITKTAGDPSLSHLFWFLNNGITIVCDKADLTSDPDDPRVKIRNLQIVNGCQTASALAHALSAGDLKPDTRVLVKIFETKDATLASKIVLTTNNQNRISTRDLKSNDSIQQDMQVAFQPYGLLYEHKSQQFANVSLKPGERFVSNEEVGQAYLALALRVPSDARRRKYKLWSEYYEEVFNGKAIEAHVLCTLICVACADWTRKSKKQTTKDEDKRKIIANGMFHIARIATALWRKKDTFNQPGETINKEVAALRKNSASLVAVFPKALDVLQREIKKNPAFATDIDAALKSALLDAAITKTLNTKK